MHRMTTKLKQPERWIYDKLTQIQANINPIKEISLVGDNKKIGKNKNIRKQYDYAEKM